MPSLRLAPSALALAFSVLALAGCKTSTVPTAPDEPTEPVENPTYSAHVRPILAEHDALGLGDAYGWDALFAAEAGAAIVPFDAERSLFVRLVEDLPADASIPYPNLRDLSDAELQMLKNWIEAGARNDDGAVPYADAEHVLFVAMQGENYVALVDAARRRVIRHVHFDDHGLPSVPHGPHYMTFEPDESAWYVSLVSAGVVAKLSMDLTMDPSDPAYLLAHSAPGGFTTPGMMALDAHAGRLYVGRSTASSASTYGLGVFAPASMEQIEEFPLPAYDIPHALALTPDGRYLLTAPLTGRDALVVDAASGDLVSRTNLGDTNRELVHFSLLPDGTTATLTSNGGASEVLFFQLSDDGTLAPDGAAPTGARAWHAHLDSDGRTVLVPNRADNSVTLIDVPSKSVRLTAENASPDGPIAMPHSPAPTYEGAFFVTSSNLQGTWQPPFNFLDADPDGDGVREPLPNDAFGNLTVLDAETGAAEAVIPLGRYPSGVEHPMGSHGDHGMDHGGHH